MIQKKLKIQKHSAFIYYTQVHQSYRHRMRKAGAPTAPNKTRQNRNRWNKLRFCNNCATIYRYVHVYNIIMCRRWAIRWVSKRIHGSRSVYISILLSIGFFVAREMAYVEYEGGASCENHVYFELWMLDNERLNGYGSVIMERASFLSKKNLRNVTKTTCKCSDVGSVNASVSIGFFS